MFEQRGIAGYDAGDQRCFLDPGVRESYRPIEIDCPGCAALGDHPDRVAVAKYERIGQVRTGIEHRARCSERAIVVEFGNRNDAVASRVHKIFHEQIHAAVVLERKRIGVEAAFVIGKVVPAARRMCP